MPNTDGNITIGTTVDMGGMNTGLKKISQSWKKLQYATGSALGVIGLVKFGKAALDAASDLQEVQNIVDVAFGDMSGKMESFAQTAIEKFGMSELAAKQTGGSFMAMGKSMGLTMEQASDMAISLTGLTGDMASFYNISQDYARVALSAVYTGETETLKRYGIVLTEANLQEYANTLGIQTKVKAMDSASKAMLRYQYILKATSDMQGDFARTSGSWANQVRLLKEQWTVFLNVVGTGLITVLTPLLQMLNAVMAAIIRLARVIGAALVNIFGLKIQSVSDQFDAVASSAGDAATGVGSVGDAADSTGKSAKKANKELKTMLGSYDELHVIEKDNPSNAGGGSGGAGGGGGGGIGDFGIPEAGSSMLDDLKDVFSDIDNMFDLGRMLSEKITKSLNNIPWAKIQASFNEFCTKIAQFLNGLITPDLFAAVGSTLAEALNTAIGGAFAFGTEFDFTNLGVSLAAGVNSFFKTFNWGQFADTIDVWVQGLYEMIKAFIGNLSWSTIFDGIVDFLSHIDLKTIEIVIGAIALKNVGKWVLTSALPGLVTAVTELLSSAFTTAFAVLVTGGSMAAAVTSFFESIFGAGSVLATVATVLTGIAVTVGGLVLGVKNFVDMWVNGWDILSTVFEAIGIAIAAIGAMILGVPTTVALVVAGIVFAVSQIAIAIHDNWDAIVSWASGIPDWWSTNVITPVAGFFTTLGTNITSALDTAKSGVQTAWGVVGNWFNSVVTSPVGKWFTGLGKTIQDVFKTAWIIVKAAWKIASTWFNDTVIKPMSQFFSDGWKNITGFFSSAWDTVKGVWKTASGWFDTNVTKPLDTGFDTTCTSISGFFSDAWGKAKEVWKDASDWFDKNVAKPLKSVFKGIWKAIKGSINDWIGGIENFINFIIDGINVFLGGLEAIGRAAASITGSEYSGITKISRVELPRLAQGAVIPPNKEFMAVLGDQKQGTNIEAPLSTIQEAVANVLEPYLAQIAANTERTANKDLTVQIGDRDIARANQRGQRVMGLQLRTS